MTRASSSRGSNGLRQVVVGAELEADDAVHRLAARRQHEQRQVPRARLAAQLAAEVEAVAVGQHQVEDQRVEARRGEAAARLREAAGRLDLEAGAAEVLDQHRGQAGVVVDKKQARGHGELAGMRPGCHVQPGARAGA